VNPQHGKGAYVALTNNSQTDYRNLVLDCRFLLSNDVVARKVVLIGELPASSHFEVRSASGEDPNDKKARCEQAVGTTTSPPNSIAVATVPVP
jgi:hypothetical protein